MPTLPDQCGMVESSPVDEWIGFQMPSKNWTIQSGFGMVKDTILYVNHFRCLFSIGLVNTWIQITCVNLTQLVLLAQQTYIKVLLFKLLQKTCKKMVLGRKNKWLQF